MDPLFVEEMLDARSQRYLASGRTRCDALDQALADFLNDATARLDGSELFFFRAVLAGARRALDAPFQATPWA